MLFLLTPFSHYHFMIIHTKCHVPSSPPLYTKKHSYYIANVDLIYGFQQQILYPKLLYIAVTSLMQPLPRFLAANQSLT